MVAATALMVDLAARPCLVVGGGAVAAGKVRTLLEGGARVTVRSPELSPSLALLHEAGELAWSPGPYGGLASPDAGWALVVAATDDPDLNRSVASDAAAAGAWCCVASDADASPVAFPAVWRSGPLTVAVSSGGIHPGASRWARDRAAEAIGDEPGVALALVEELRRSDAAAGGPGRRPDWRSAVESGMLVHIRAGQLAQAKERLEACLSSSSD